MGNRFAAVCAVLMFFSGMAAAGQSPVAEETAAGKETGEKSVSPVFPIHRLWKDAEKNAVYWQPDWPLDIPPDSFSPVNSGQAWQVTITVQNAGENAELPNPAADPAESAEPPVLPAEYTARLSPDGRLVEFPFLWDGVFYQASVQYGREGVIEAMTLALSPENSAEIVVLKTDEGRPVTARIKTGGVYYFASFLWTTSTEMWTDATGLLLEVLRDERVFHHDSMQNITFISDGAREVSARYNGNGPRYWTRDGTTLSLQRDETGLLVRLLLVRLRDTTETTDATNRTDTRDIKESGDETPINSSYEYRFDQKGNWTERREIRWTRLNGYLAPQEGVVVTRIIEY